MSNVWGTSHYVMGTVHGRVIHSNTPLNPNQGEAAALQRGGRAERGQLDIPCESRASNADTYNTSLGFVIVVLVSYTPQRHSLHITPKTTPSGKAIQARCADRCQDVRIAAPTSEVGSGCGLCCCGAYRSDGSLEALLNYDYCLMMFVYLAHRV